MREFFKGRRRKAGCVTLGLAGLLMVLWLRTLVYVDLAWFPFTSQMHTIGSVRGGFFWLITPSWSTNRGHEAIEVAELSALQKSAGPVDFVESVFDTRECGYVMYWQLTLPLALLSAVLLFWPSRPKPSPNL
jgi:hypothetical protein